MPGNQDVRFRRRGEGARGGGGCGARLTLRVLAHDEEEEREEQEEDGRMCPFQRKLLWRDLHLSTTISEI